MSEAFLQMAGVFSQLELSMIRARVRSGMENAKGKQIGRPQVTADDVPSGFLRHYPAYKSKQLNVSESANLARRYLVMPLASISSLRWIEIFP